MPPPEPIAVGGGNVVFLGGRIDSAAARPSAVELLVDGAAGARAGHGREPRGGRSGLLVDGPRAAAGWRGPRVDASACASETVPGGAAAELGTFETDAAAERLAGDRD